MTSPSSAKFAPKPGGHSGSREVATRHFTRGLIAFAVLYSLWAAVLSFRVVVKQQAVRRELEVALRQQPRGLFPTAAAAHRAARRLATQLNTLFPHNPCGAGPAFIVAQNAPVSLRDCLIVITIRGRRLLIHGYDTQGHRMDTIFERLNPPPRRL